MTNNIKKDKELLKKLESGKETDIISAIKTIRNEGNIHYLPDILNVFNDKTPITVTKEITSLISDLKNTDNELATNFIINFIKTLKNEEHITIFTSCCWQSKLDFTNHINYFIELIIKGSYQSAIEAFTVIENCLPNIKTEVLENQIEIIKNSIDKMNDEKKIFVFEILKTLESAKSY